jgi:V/A-type H+-transporting ATPase subunit I
MAVLQMQRICICGLKKDRKKVLELLQRQSVIEIHEMMDEDNIFKKSDVSVVKSLLEKNISSSTEALAILDRYSPHNKSMLAVLYGRREVSTDDYNAFSVKHDGIVHTVNRINALSKGIAEMNAEILKLEANIITLIPWAKLDISLNFNGTKHSKTFIGSLPNEWTLESLHERLADLTPLEIEIISSSREQTCVFVLCSKNDGDKVYEELRAMGFSHPNSITDKVPLNQLNEIEEQMKQLKRDIVAAEDEIKSYATMRDDILFLSDYETMRLSKYDVLGQVVQSNKSFFLTGYIPKKDGNDLVNLLNNRFTISAELEDPDEDEEVPVLLQNNGFASPLESTVEAYSPPTKGEMDPTMMMSLFYYVLFGIMLSDAGYGAIIAIACGVILLKFKNTLEPSLKKTLTMYFLCGISTVFWGIIFGSYFGDLLDVTTTKFFGGTITIRPLWFFPVEQPMKMLTFSMALGVIHLLTGLGLKGYQSIKRKDYKSFIYDVVYWYVLLISCILVLLSTDMFLNIIGLTYKLPSMVGTIAGILAVLSSVGIILTNGRESKNPFKRFLKGLYAFYGLSGYLSDVLSYSRLLALGLATGVICSVINKMAAMVPGGVIGAILFTIIIVFGHTLNLAINALGAYVHTNRLQYVEFFGKFYEGGGRKFSPFSTNTKYYRIKEKN